MFSLVPVTPPAVEPVTLAEAKTWLRVDASNTADDDLIEGLITAARVDCENYTRRSFIATGWRFATDRFPGLVFIQRQPALQPLIPDFPWYRPGVDALFMLPAPLISVESVQYVDPSTGVLTTLDPANYTVDTDTEPARIAPAYGKPWPFTRYQISAVKVNFTAGYGTDADSVPAPIKTAIKMLLADMYDQRGAKSTLQLISNPTLQSILYPYRVFPIEVAQ